MPTSAAAPKRKSAITALRQEFTEYRAQNDEALDTLLRAIETLRKLISTHDGEVAQDGCGDEVPAQGNFGTVKRAADKFPRTQSGIWGMIRRGAVKRVRVGGRILVSFDDIARELQKKNKKTS